MQQISKEFIARVASLKSGAAKANVTLFLLCKDAVNKAYAKSNDHAQYALNELPVSYRSSVAHFLRRCGLNVTVLSPKDNNGKRDGYIVGGVLDHKKQATVQGKLNEWADVHAGRAPRGEGFKGDVITLEERTYKEPVKKELSGDAIEVEKRAKLAVANLISRMRDKDSAAAGVLNMLWANKNVHEMAFIDATGQVIGLSVDETNAVMGFIHELRK